jgi:GNAT superfamily N-acetyltransferase
LLGQLGYPSEAGQVVTRLARIAVEQRGAVFVAADGDRIVGVVAAHIFTPLHDDASAAWITSLVVQDDERRHGIGRRLVEAAETWARTRGCRRVALTSANRREEAHTFYEGLGYEFTGKRFSKVLGKTD